MAIEDPELLAVWPQMLPGVSETKKDHYCNLILNLQKVAYEADTIELAELRGALNYLMTSHDVYLFWQKARTARIGVTGGDEAEDFFTSEVDKAFEGANPPQARSLTSILKSAAGQWAAERRSPLTAVDTRRSVTQREIALARELCEEITATAEVHSLLQIIEYDEGYEIAGKRRLNCVDLRLIPVSARSSRVSRDLRLRITVRGLIQRVALGNLGKPVRAPVRSVGVDEDVVLVGTERGGVIPWRVRFLPDNRCHEVFRPEPWFYAAEGSRAAAVARAQAEGRYEQVADRWLLREAGGNGAVVISDPDHRRGVGEQVDQFVGLVRADEHALIGDGDRDPHGISPLCWRRPRSLPYSARSSTARTGSPPMNHSARLDTERQLIREAAARLLDGTARQSSGQLNIVTLAQECGINRARLYEQHADLVAGFKAKAGLGHIPPAVRALQGQLAAASQQVSELQAANRHLEQRIQTLTAVITELTLDTTPDNVIPLRG